MGFKFVDVSDAKNAGRHEWSLSAPDWRKAQHGLCFEGICTTMSCVAYDEKVIWNAGFTGPSGFVVEEYAPSVCCPICDEQVELTTCAFNNCDWRVEGKKWESFKKPPIPFNGKFNRADDAYFVFDENIRVNWLTLTIVAVPNGQGCTESSYALYAS